MMNMRSLQEEIEQSKDTYADVVSEEEWSQRTEIVEEARAAKKMLALVTEDAFSIQSDRDRNSLLSNAAITPYETRIY